MTPFKSHLAAEAPQTNSQDARARGALSTRRKNRRWLFHRAWLAALLLFLSAPQSMADSVPDWLKAAMSSDSTPLSRVASSVVLLDEESRRIRSNGDADVSYRLVVRILKADGRAAAVKTVNSDNETVVSSLKAWHVHPDGKVIKLNKQSVSEESTEGLYSDIRRRVMKFDDVAVGSVVAFEWKLKEHPVANEDIHAFQGPSPVVLSRYKLSIPREWKLRSQLFNHEPAAPVVTGSTIYSWEFKDLPAIEQVPMMPDASTLSAQVEVSYFPPRGKLLKNSFAAWREASAWAARLMDLPGPVDTTIETRARELTAGLTTNEEKIRALTRFVQEIRYVSIQLGAIGGYRPHPARLILKAGYGDCKDKASLLRALLTSVGLSSYNVLVHSGDPTFVRADPPSVLPFNHAIVAISVGEDGQMTVNAGALGKLLLFDPTDEITPIGDLPFYLQESYGLIVSKEAGALVRLPASSETANRMLKTITIDVTPGGLLSAKVMESFSGQRAAQVRRLLSTRQSSYQTEIEHMAAGIFSRLKLNKLVFRGQSDHSVPLDIEYELQDSASAPSNEKLLIIKPFASSPRFFMPLEAQQRRLPVVLQMKSIQEDSVTINIPAEYRVDEHPVDVDLEGSFGRFELRHRMENGKLVLERRLLIRQSLVNLNDWSQLSEMIEDLNTSMSASVILERNDRAGKNGR
ncbi:MAG: hypothetical protein DMF61_24370 [Blastocatellia bacterium AA13]|nr:MAG: hypothetical protein DMF61_24370 [Blastocatellia bacterium AA13]